MEKNATKSDKTRNRLTVSVFFKYQILHLSAVSVATKIYHDMSAYMHVGSLIYVFRNKSRFLALMIIDVRIYVRTYL